MAEPQRGPNWGRLALAAIPLLVFAGLVVFFIRALDEGPAVRLSGRVGQPAPVIDLPPQPGLTTARLSSTDFHGKWVVVNFWASWCGPCRIEHPLLMDLDRSDKYELVGIAYKDTPARSAAFLAELGDPFDRLGADADGRTAIEWGVSGVPETFLIAPDGTVVAHQPGPLTPEAIAAWPRAD